MVRRLNLRFSVDFEISCMLVYFDIYAELVFDVALKTYCF